MTEFEPDKPARGTSPLAVALEWIAVYEPLRWQSLNLPDGFFEGQNSNYTSAKANEHHFRSRLGLPIQASKKNITAKNHGPGIPLD